MIELVGRCTDHEPLEVGDNPTTGGRETGVQDFNCRVAIENGRVSDMDPEYEGTNGCRVLLDDGISASERDLDLYGVGQPERIAERAIANERSASDDRIVRYPFIRCLEFTPQ